MKTTPDNSTEQTVSLLAQHGQVDLSNQEGRKEVDADCDTLGWGAGLNGVNL
jgi:hypothetical protein